MKKEIHVFDIDGTIIKGEPIADSLGKMFNKVYPYSELVHYDIGDNLIRLGWIESKSDFCTGTFFKEYQKEIFQDVEVITGFHDYLKELEERQSEILFLTARPNNLKEITVNFFVEQGLERYLDRIVVDKHRNKEKLNYVTKKFTQKVNMYEDKPSTLIDFHTGGHNVIKVEQPYNTDIMLADRFTSIKNYNELLTKINTF